MMRIALIVGASAFSMALLSSPAFSEPSTAGQFFDQCQQRDPVTHTGCIQFVEGTIDGYFLGEDRGARRVMCRPTDGNAEEWFHHVERFIREHPEARDRATVDVIIWALGERWHC